MTDTRLNKQNIFALGFMTFAFFLGAGNIIFPPLAGQLAGSEVTLAMLGFLVTAVGLPLLTLIAVAIAGGDMESVTRDLPRAVAVTITVAIFIVIGPAFALPRTSLVAYETGMKPLFGEDAVPLWAYTIGFFLVASALALHRGSLIDYIGKILTPILIVLLAILGISVVVEPLAPLGAMTDGTAISAASEAYRSAPFSKGFIEGYNTMDTFGALMFGVLIVDVLRKKGVNDRGFQASYLIQAGIIAAIGLALVYMSLFYLGATSGTVAAGADNGGEILAKYVQGMFGQPGQWILSAVVTLACLTTAIGLTGACSDYFANLLGMQYRTLVVVFAAVSALVANVGLSYLIAVSIPVLIALYPVAVALVVLNLVRRYLNHPKQSFRWVIGIALVLSLLDAIKAAKVPGTTTLVETASHLPLFGYGLAWLIPVTAAVIVALAWPDRSSKD
ncbi:branched-chain amino acid transport system II carrier protein [Neiella marina]|uniref:Branched-chain amino acid transport system carrier protein n=1 Tax=Neiella holothuriorum TaxID=2870530 RepID=A0ABS7EJE0_9GAMM|nr:branched-chain amino acid transport system II carrier protein [Neiella holothuriorum]MBW8192344.1 branched-chain amino acid transport system II carrier protein [Neiella holothuriorum]